MLIYFTYLLTFIVTVMCIHMIKLIAERICLVDIPNPRKHHPEPVPLVGGIAIVFGIGIGLLVLDISIAPYRSFLAGIILMGFVGLLDDFHELKPHTRLWTQIIVGLLMTIWGEVYLHTFGNILFVDPIVLGNWGIPITIFALVCIINAINMLDGLDGLAGGISWIQLTMLFIIAGVEGRLMDMHILALIAAALLGFLVFNFPFNRARVASVFMGDAGSMVLGFCLVWFTVSLSQGAQAIAPVVMLWVMIVPIFDFCGVVSLRLLQRQPLLKPDRQHIHHWLQQMGLHPRTITMILSLVTLITSSLAFILNKIGVADGYLFIGFMLLFIGYLSGIVWFLRHVDIQNYQKKK